MRKTIPFDKNWLFHKGDIKNDFPATKGPLYAMAKTGHAQSGPASRGYPAYADDYGNDGIRSLCTERWEYVELPHDYIISQTPCEEYNNAVGFFKYENAWYRKSFRLEPEDIPKPGKHRRYLLEFDGIATYATVYINNCPVARSFEGHTPFEADITDFIDYDGENIIAVYVESGTCETWWYEGGGIYRHVRLVITDDIAIDRYGVYVCPKLENGVWQTEVETTVISERKTPAKLRAVSTIYAPDGSIAAVTEGELTATPYDKSNVKYNFALESPLLWDTETPNLYRAHTVLYENDIKLDELITRFGFRTFTVDPEKGLFLNGRHVKIKGVCAHEDFGLTGKAVSDNILKHKIKLIREMGANGYRTSHYPHSDATMDALDEYGFIVMDELRHFSSAPEGLKELETLVKRDRNRPSVFCYSIANEECYTKHDEGRRIAKKMTAVLKKLDPMRHVTLAYSHEPEKAQVFDELDLIGINYHIDCYDLVHSKYPRLGIVSSENCAIGTSRSHYLPDSPTHGMCSAVEHSIDNGFSSTREDTWKAIAARDFVIGGYQWIAFEHRGEAVWPRLCSISGAMDLFLQKKEAFYQNLAAWCDDKPVLHIATHWNFEGYENEPLEVCVFTNCDEVALWLNGKPIERRRAERYTPVRFTLGYAPGELKAVGYSNGKEVACDIRKTTGKGETLALDAENSGLAEHCDVLLFTCTVLDSNGLEVPDASPFVSFYTNEYGTIIGTGSSNTDHNPVTLPERRMYGGKISVAVKLIKSGMLKLYAQSEGLRRAVISLEV